MLSVSMAAAWLQRLHRTFRSQLSISPGDVIWASRWAVVRAKTFRGGGRGPLDSEKLQRGPRVSWPRPRPRPNPSVVPFNKPESTESRKRKSTQTHKACGAVGVRFSRMTPLAGWRRRRSAARKGLMRCGAVRCRRRGLFALVPL